MFLSGTMKQCNVGCSVGDGPINRPFPKPSTKRRNCSKISPFKGKKSISALIFATRY